MINFLNQIISDFISVLTTQAQNFFENISLSDYSWSKIVFDVFLVSMVFYTVLKWIKGSRAVNMLLGFAILGVAFAVSRIFELEALSTLLNSFLTMLVVAVPIVFQQELRRGLEQLGRTSLFSFSIDETGIKGMIKNVVNACELLARKQHGALIVIERQVGLIEYAETGVILNAKVSKELLLNTFFPKSPLHDGAVIIKEDKLFAAGCVLPISHKTYDYLFGPRHKSALGLSELTDAIVIVVSEERGEISFVKDGLIQKNISADRLEKILESILIVPKTGIKIKDLLKRKYKSRIKGSSAKLPRN